MILQTRIPPPLLALATAVSMWGLDRYIPGFRVWHAPWSRVGWLCVGIGIAIDLASVARFIQARTTVNPMRTERVTHLVTTGLYAYSRNPMYLGLLLALIGWGLLLGSVTPLAAIVIWIRSMVSLQIEPEERVLAARFGHEYVAYTRRVARWLGRSRTAKATHR